MDPRLAEWIAALGPDRWAAFLLDAEDRLVWVSAELQAFLDEHDEGRLGYGRHIVTAFLSPTWRATMTERSQLETFGLAMPYLVHRMPAEVLEDVPAEFRSALAALAPKPQPAVWTGSFEYVPPRGGPSYPVEYVVTVLRDDQGALVGTLMLTNVGLRPTLLSLLGRGDAAMYERMARLVEPGRHAAAVLFADLQDSGELSRQLPTPAYFRLVRDLTSAFDDLVARHRGIVGKHAGDGMTAFFLAADQAGLSQTARAAVATAAGLRRAAARAEGAPAGLRINVGLHWGAGLYLGQLVPGGRLDVTALGDEVNECARIQECARDGRILASKSLVELLTDTDATQLGLDPAALRYRPIASLPGAGEKARRDAGTVAVTELVPEPG